MRFPIVSQKLERPAPSTHEIPRLRLYEMLRDWQRFRCVYVHGPAGSGKSVLVSSWLEHHLPQNSETSPTSAWLSPDQEDRDPLYWLWYVATALDRLQPGLLAQVLPLLLDGTMAPERVLGYVLSSMQPEMAGPGLLVLEDYHRVESPPVDRLLSILLERSPAWLHFVLISRRATAAPLNRLIATNRVLEIDNESLRFRRDELTAYLETQGMAELPDHLADLLLERTEGWIAALHLAGLGALRQPDPAHLFADLRGDQGWLAGYLVGEVLTQLPPDQRRFLLQTSILERFNASLAQAVTQIQDTYRLLNETYAANLFLIPLGGIEKWFRYHHLFQELLQHRLHTELAPEGVGALHRRAAMWLIEAGEIDQALRHLLAIPDIDAGVELVEAHARPAMVRGDGHRVERWIARLPEKAVSAHLSLLIELALLYGLRDDPEMAKYVRQAEYVLAMTEHATERERAELLVLVATCHALQGNFVAMGESAHQAYLLLAHLDDLMMGNLHFILMHYAMHGGKLKDAWRHGIQAVDAYVRAGFTVGVISVRREIGSLAMGAGHSQLATRQFEELDRQGLDVGPFALRELGVAHIRAARHFYWLNRLQQAHHHQQAALAVMQQLHDPGFIAEAQCMGQLLHATDPTLVSSAEDFDVHDLAVHAKQYISPYLYWARLLVKRGDAAEAQKRIGNLTEFRSPALPIHDLMRRITGLHVATLSGHALASITPEYAQALDEIDGDDGHFSRLLLLGLFAWHRLRLGNRKAAAALLDEALDLAGSSGYTRSILDLPELAPLLTDANHPAAPVLLQQMGQENGYSGYEPLTAQELTVLQLLDRDYKYREIADELVITVATVRFHVHNVYTKMGVNRRMDAVRLAKRRGIIPAAGE